MTDETVAIYIVNVTGTPNTDNKEENEDIEILYFLPEQFNDLQAGKYGPVAIKTNMMLTLLSSFLNVY